MQEPHYYKLGSPTSLNGAVFLVKDEEGQILAEVEMYKAYLHVKGKEVTPQIEKMIDMYCREQNDKLNKEVDSLGIPAKLKELLAFTKKSKVEAFCKRITITEHEIYLLVHNCSQIGFTHKSKFPEFVPESRKLKDSDWAEMKQSRPNNFLNKVDRIFEERKNYMVHLFEKGTEWHCFYYTYKEMEKGEKGHWEGGSHLHYLSYLWTEYGKRRVWDSFDKRHVEIKGIHIKLEPYDMDESKHYTIPAADIKFLETLKNLSI
jgi:hypothetical protein